ncbi:MAG: FkbM family methyltransferase [Alphaproteobacteria bacterium]|nr:FkbM family methyltransferase [Alphaproteobacteria bacterium]
MTNDGLAARGSPLLRFVQARQWDQAIALARRPGAARDPDIARRVIAYCTAMREGRREHRVQVGDIAFTLRLGEDNFGHDIFVAAGELQEQREMQIIATLPAPPGSTLVDVGANAGAWTVFLAKAFPLSTVVPLECVPALCEEVRANVALNGLANVDLGRLGRAVGRGPGRARLVPDAYHGAVGTRVTRDDAGDVEVVSIDSLALQQVAFVKIDVEGQEIAALDGLTETIRRKRFPVLVEVQSANWLRFLKFLCTKQWRVLAISEGPVGATYANILIGPV